MCSGEEQLASCKTLVSPNNPRRYAPPQAGAFLWLVPRDSYKRGNPGCGSNRPRRGAWLSTHREPRRSSTSPHAIAATRGNQRTQVNPKTGATARRRVAAVAAPNNSEARSPPLSLSGTPVGPKNVVERRPPFSYVATNFVRHLTNFRRSVLLCVEASDSESRRILQHFSKSTRYTFFCTAQNSDLL